MKDALDALGRAGLFDRINIAPGKVPGSWEASLRVGSNRFAIRHAASLGALLEDIIRPPPRVSFETWLSMGELPPWRDIEIDMDDLL